MYGNQNEKENEFKMKQMGTKTITKKRIMTIEKASSDRKAIIIMIVDNEKNQKKKYDQDKQK